MIDELELNQDAENLDFFGDSDLADATNLPAGGRYIGYVSKVDVSQSLPGQYRKLNKPLKDGRMEVPQIDVAITALSHASNGKFADDTNFYKTATLNYWIAKEDRIGRHSLARLIENVAGVDEETIKSTPIRELAVKLEKCYVTFDVSHRAFTGKNGEAMTAQDFTKIKPATLEEVEAAK